MDRSLLKEELKRLSDGLVSIRRDISRQIRRQTKYIVFIEKRLKRLKSANVRLREKKREIGDNFNRVCGNRNSLRVCVTNEPHQPHHDFSSDDGVDTDNLSDDSTTDVEEEKLNTQVSRKDGLYVWDKICNKIPGKVSLN